MFILNPTDLELTSAVSEMPPVINGSEELHIPARHYALAPRTVTEVSDLAGDLLIRKWKERYGVVRVRPTDDVAELTKEGRRTWRSMLERDVSDFRQESDRRTSAGAPPAVPSTGWLGERIRTIAVLQHEEAVEVARLLGQEAPPPPAAVETPAEQTGALGFTGLDKAELDRRRRAFLQVDLEGEDAAAEVAAAAAE